MANRVISPQVKAMALSEHLVHHKSFRSIAKTLGIDERTVKRVVNAALKEDR